VFFTGVFNPDPLFLQSLSPTMKLKISRTLKDLGCVSISSLASLVVNQYIV